MGPTGICKKGVWEGSYHCFPLPCPFFHLIFKYKMFDNGWERIKNYSQAMEMEKSRDFSKILGIYAGHQSPHFFYLEA